MEPARMRFDGDLAVKMTGLTLTRSEMRRCLRRSRLDLDRRGADALIPRYRVDILHPVDLAEEVAIGYGLDRIEPLYPASADPGGYDRLNVALDRISETMSRAGFIEAMSYDLVDSSSLYELFSRSQENKVEVENPRTSEHHILRDAIVPSLMSVLSRNVNAVYPQRIFEVGKVYLGEEDEDGGRRVREAHHLGALTAHSSSSFSEAKMYLEALVREHSGEGKLGSRAGVHWAFAEGRCAEVSLDGRAIGHLGEVKASVLAAFGLDVPVAGFEVDLSVLAS
jgi:phenylalanyl-tRNA synthetase beta chain